MREPLGILLLVLAAACGSSSPGSTVGDAGSRSDAERGADASSDAAKRDGAASDGRATDGPAKDTGSGDSGGEGSGPTVGGCPVFPPDYPYNQDISSAPLDPGSATYISNLTSRTGVIDAPSSASEYPNIVPESQPDVTVTFDGSGAVYGFDPTTNAFYTAGGTTGSAPIPSGVVYEDMTTPNSDHHMMVIEQGACRLFELYAWNPSSSTSGWEVMVTWNLTKSDELPDGWGSTTAAGTPLLAGIIRYDEVMSGEIQHALDIVIPGTDLAAYEYVRPAARSAGACGSSYPTDGFPYGGRLRLKASYDTSGFTGSQAAVIARALRKYGMINTDDSGYSRSDFRLGPGSWDASDLSQLVLTWDDFEVPEMTVIDSKACN